MNDLHILIARLGWPSTSTRWWTMQELAVRLGEPATKPETESSLLHLLRSCKLEAEVVEVLCIFWMAAQTFGYSPSLELADSILLPSPLSDLLMNDCGLPIQTSYVGLEEVPEDFKPPEDFNGVQGVDLPKIFRTSMSKLETYSKLPFVRQMAFEWTKNRAAYPGAPYQGDLGHFIRPLGDGFIGQFSARAALRAISAYLRTLAVAKQLWNMPPVLADQKSLLALPIHPTLALLRSKRPNWFPAHTDFDGDTQAIETSFHALLSRVGVTHPGDELIAFNSPVLMSMERCVEVSLVRWSQTICSDVEDADLAPHLESFWTHGHILSSQASEPLTTTTLLVPPILEKLIDDASEAWPLAGTLDLDRIGYLQHDLYPSRLFLPTIPGVDKIEITPQDGQLQIKVENQVIADLCYWNAGWEPARPRQFHGNCGTALISRGTAYRESTETDSSTLRAFYLWQIRTLYRNNSFDEFCETLASGVIFV
ncbi:multidrug DMT transporter permease [Pectobacterium sp. A535-S3-A17]|uniref:multidrug DMT transporter permease n=1 Tax=Pectobacterium quasiaquaticum TaxID=2774015 RepID=UPI001875D220|nr:multidrug DMT transporter permease [Pectobacterium quasiaquaticum]MBE5214761.1 multidrug DMT transporter permease [Pectobacterium quasiaquaticum]MBE5224800.1 multidrug DMT transporter permease [Pectobacterium quasiaquaticum]